METIGFLCFPPSHLLNLKRLALFFDKLAVLEEVVDDFDYDLDYQPFGFAYDGDQARLEMDWLISEGIMQALPSDVPESITSKPEIQDLLKPYLENWAGDVGLDNDQGQISEEEEMSQYLSDVVDPMSRFVCASLRFYKNMNIVPVLHSSIYSIDKRAEKQDVYEVIVNNLPVPVANTPWEAIAEFRQDQDAQNKLKAIKVWISDVCRAGFKYSEVHEKLEYLLYEYKSAMELHTMKTHVGTLGTVLMTLSEVAENLITLKPSKAIKTLFEIKSHKVALLEAEKSAPGREIAYIVKAQEKFGYQ